MKEQWDDRGECCWAITAGGRFCCGRSDSSVLSSHCNLTAVYRFFQEEWTKLRESVPYVELYRYNPKHLCPKLNGYGDNGHRKVWASGVPTYCSPSVTELGDRRYTRSAVGTVHLAPDGTECDCGQSRGVSIVTTLGDGRSGVRFSAESRDFTPKRTNRLCDPLSPLYS